MDPVALRIGPITIYWYGLLIVIGAIVAAVIAWVEAKRRGENPEHVWNLVAWVLLFGIIGARLYHVVSSPAGGFPGWEYYRSNPIEIIAFWKSGFRGLGIIGAIAGGILAILIYTRLAHLVFLRWTDIVAPGTLLAQAMGRWGNYINQELYGPPTSLPWGIQIDTAHRFGPYVDLSRFPLDTRFHPTFLYESIWNLAGFALLMWVGRRYADRLRDGDITFFYLIYYAAGRLWLEILRPDAWLIGPFPAAQLFALAMMVIGVTGLYLRHRTWKPPETWYQHRQTPQTQLPGAHDQPAAGGV